MHEIKSQAAPKIFQNKFHKLTRKYPTNFSTSNHSIKPFKLCNSKNTPQYGRTKTLRKCKKM